jgi:hypothetical protein
MVTEALKKQISQDLRFEKGSELGWRSLLNAVMTYCIKQYTKTIEFELQANLRMESDLNFVQMNLLTQFSNHMYQLSHLSNVWSKLLEHVVINLQTAYHVLNKKRSNCADSANEYTKNLLCILKTESPRTDASSR